MKRFLTSKPITKPSEAYDTVKEIYEEAFPKDQRVPLWVLRFRSDSNDIDFLGIYDNEVLVGFTYLIHKRDMTFVLYLAIDSAKRQDGYGSFILDSIQNSRPNDRMILCIEALDSSAENYTQRVKRKQFYEKNGYRETGIFTEDYGVRNEILIHGNDTVTFEEIKSLWAVLATPLFAPFLPLFIKQVEEEAKES